MDGPACRFLTRSFALVLLIPYAFAQGTIDPSLPPAPLTYTRTLELFPGIDTVKNPDAILPPLTARQKYQIFWRRTVDISLPVEALMFASASQAVHYSPHYGSGGVAFAERFGSYAGSIASSAFFGDAFFPVLFHQDPRYFRKAGGSTASRIWHAFESDFVTHTDSGGLAFNASGVLGFGASTALTNAWYPRSSVTLGSTLQRFGIKLALSATLNLIREFGGTREGGTEHVIRLSDSAGTR